MDNTTVLNAEFGVNCKANIGRLRDLFEQFDLAKLGYDTQNAHERDCYNEALKAKEYYAAKTIGRCSVKKGDRILEEDMIFLMSDADFKRLLSDVQPLLKRADIVDENGNYKVDWFGIKRNARRELVNFIIDVLIPESLRDQFDAVRKNVVQSNRLFDVVRPLVTM